MIISLKNNIFPQLNFFDSGHTLEFVIEPSDTVVQEGNSAVLDCVVKSDLPSNVINTIWLDKDREPMSFIGDQHR